MSYIARLQAIGAKAAKRKAARGSAAFHYE